MKLKTFLDKVNNPNWKKYEEKKKYVGYTLKDPVFRTLLKTLTINKDTKILAVKGTKTVKASLELIETAYRKIHLSSKWVDFLEKCDMLKQEENYQLVHVFHKLPFPLTSRDVLMHEV